MRARAAIGPRGVVDVHLPADAPEEARQLLGAKGFVWNASRGVWTAPPTRASLGLARYLDPALAGRQKPTKGPRPATLRRPPEGLPEGFPYPCSERAVGQRVTGKDFAGTVLGCAVPPPGAKGPHLYVGGKPVPAGRVTAALRDTRGRFAGRWDGPDFEPPDPRTKRKGPMVPLSPIPDERELPVLTGEARHIPRAQTARKRALSALRNATARIDAELGSGDPSRAVVYPFSRGLFVAALRRVTDAAFWQNLPPSFGDADAVALALIEPSWYSIWRMGEGLGNSRGIYSRGPRPLPSEQRGKRADHPLNDAYVTLKGGTEVEPYYDGGATWKSDSNWTRPGIVYEVDDGVAAVDFGTDSSGIGLRFWVPVSGLRPL